MKIRVCHVTSVHPVMDIRIFWKECLSLTKKYDVSLIAPNTKERDEMGVHIHNIDIPRERLKRQFYLSRVYKKMIEIDADVYHLHDPELMRLGIRIKNKGKKVIFDSHEDVPMQIRCKEYLPNFVKLPISYIYSLYERSLLKKYDALISVTPSIVERLTMINPNTYMVTNFPALEEISKREVAGDKIICFAGGVSQKYMHENVIKALGETKAKYLLAGPSYPGYLDELKKLKGWQQVEYLGVVGHEEVYNIYKRATAGVVLLDYTANVGYHRGTLGVLKLFEYMMVGLPVIATDFDLWKEIVQGYDCGICIDPHNIEDIKKAIDFFINNPEIAKNKGENGRKAVVEKYNWAIQEPILYEVYNRVLNGA